MRAADELCPGVRNKFVDYSTKVLHQCANICHPKDPDVTSECQQFCYEYYQCLVSRTTASPIETTQTTTTTEPSRDQQQYALVVLLVVSCVLFVVISVILITIVACRRRKPAGAPTVTGEPGIEIAEVQPLSEQGSCDLDTQPEQFSMAVDTPLPLDVNSNYSSHYERAQSPSNGSNDSKNRAKGRTQPWCREHRSTDGHA